MLNQISFKTTPQKSNFVKTMLGLFFTAQFVLIFSVICTLSAAAQTVIYTNGPFQTGTTTLSGVAAPAGAQWSEAASDTGVTTAANTSAGAGCQTIATTTENRCADNFVVPVGETWTITSVAVFAYQTAFAGTTSPFTAATLQIWNGPPGVAGSTVIFGDTTTNRLGSSTDTNSFRVFNTVAPAPGTAPGTTRRIWQNNLTVSPGLALTAGSYWIDFSGNAGASGNFSPLATIRGTRYTPLQNSRQRTGAAPGVWADLFDTGNPATAGSVPQDFPFQLTGTRTGVRTVSAARTVNFAGDTRSDYVTARSASSTGATVWNILANGGTATGVQWGTGVGFAGGDIAVPADFNGDGTSDVAVWRPGAAQVAAFYILNSGTNTVSTVLFGQNGDDPTVVGDYDGDGRADAAVYRAGAGSGQSFFYYRATTGAANNIATAPFGIGGDKPFPGDFDGDGRFDFAVVRNEGGNARHFQQRSTQGFVSTQFGLFTDRFATGDFDGDYRHDLVAIRNNGGTLTWYVATSVTNQFIQLPFGTAATDFITPGDYDGDNRSDFAVFRSGSSGVGFYQFGTLSAPLATPFGASTTSLTAPDYPVAAYQVH